MDRPRGQTLDEAVVAFDPQGPRARSRPRRPAGRTGGARLAWPSRAESSPRPRRTRPRSPAEGWNPAIAARSGGPAPGRHAPGRLGRDVPVVRRTVGARRRMLDGPSIRSAPVALRGQGCSSSAPAGACRGRHRRAPMRQERLGQRPRRRNVSTSATPRDDPRLGPHAHRPPTASVWLTDTAGLWEPADGWTPRPSGGVGGIAAAEWSCGVTAARPARGRAGRAGACPAQRAASLGKCDLAPVAPAEARSPFPVSERPSPGSTPPPGDPRPPGFRRFAPARPMPSPMPGRTAPPRRHAARSEARGHEKKPSQLLRLKNPCVRPSYSKCRVPGAIRRRC